MQSFEIFRDSYQNWKSYQIPKAQLILSDVPYALGEKAYASNPQWYKDGDNKNGESELAGKAFFNSDYDFRPAEFMHFCSQMLKPERKDGIDEEEAEKVEMIGSKRKSNAPCMIIFVPFEQMHYYIELGARYGLKKYIPLIFRKNFSAQVLKANMKVVGNCEYALILYRSKLPKFNNEGSMIFNCMDWVKDGRDIPKVHPTQKPIRVLENLIRIFTDEGDVVIDPCAGSGSTLRAAVNLGRKAYGFEIDKKFHKEAKEKMLVNFQPILF